MECALNIIIFTRDSEWRTLQTEYMCSGLPDNSGLGFSRLTELAVWTMTLTSVHEFFCHLVNQTHFWKFDI